MRLFLPTADIMIIRPTLTCLFALLITCCACTQSTGQKKHSTGSSSRSHNRSVSAEEARAAAARKEQIRQHLINVRNHMHDVRVKILQAKKKEHQITEKIEVVQGRIDITKATLRKVDRRLSSLTNLHVAAVARLSKTMDHLASRRELLAARLRENYERRQATYTDVLIQSRTVHELLSRSFYVHRIVHADSNLVESIRTDIHTIQRDKKELENQAAEQRELEQVYEEKKATYAQDLGEKQQMLASVQEVREQAQDELDELESESAEMTSRIRALSEVLRLRQEALKREAAARARAGIKGPVPDSGAELPTVFRGGFLRPVPGHTTSTFGMRYHPILHVRKLHTGVDFSAPRGAPIHAAATGIVLLAGYTRGYGNCIIIDHGGGISTLYGHCSSLGVSEGQSIKQGQVIGRVGATGYATGPHLHFEVRKNGTPVRPPF